MLRLYGSFRTDGGSVHVPGSWGVTVGVFRIALFRLAPECGVGAYSTCGYFVSPNILLEFLRFFTSQLRSVMFLDLSPVIDCSI